MKILLLCSIMLFCGCGTITPDSVVDHQASYDSSSPQGIDPQNGGFVDWVVNKDGTTWGAVITSDARDRYNYLIENYKVQYQNAKGLKLSFDSGVTLILWKDSTPVYKIKSEYYTAFLHMNQWLKEHRDKDTVWMKLRNKL